jgi:hypothetical protein
MFFCECGAVQASEYTCRTSECAYGTDTCTGRKVSMTLLGRSEEITCVYIVQGHHDG